MERIGIAVVGAFGVVCYWLALAVVLVALAGFCGASVGVTVDWPTLRDVGSTVTYIGLVPSP